MIIDAHCHLWTEESLRGGLKKVLESIIEDVGATDEDLVFDGSVERLIADMDEAGIDKTVILPLDFDYLYADAEYTFRDFNDLAGDYLRRYPDRIIAFAGIDPRRGASAVDELKRCVEGMGFSGLKLWTVTGFLPDDAAYYPLYEEAARLGINILVHTGLGPGNTYLGTCRPLHVDKIAVDFREINFIMAHMGTPWTDEAMTVAKKNPNVYVDTSAWQAAYKLYPLEMIRIISTAKLMQGSVGKVLFGTDWPLLTEIYTQKQWVDRFREMALPSPLKSMGLPDISEEDRDMILGQNAAHALKL
jgi:predicted TIM-barrel fold metal-dependent hydrolase